MRLLRAKEARGDAVVAIEVDIVKGGGDAKPVGHGGGLAALDAGGAGDDDTAVTHGTADKNDFEFDLGANSDFFGAKEEDTS